MVNKHFIKNCWFTGCGNDAIKGRDICVDCLDEINIETNCILYYALHKKDFKTFQEIDNYVRKIENEKNEKNEKR